MKYIIALVGVIRCCVRWRLHRFTCMFLLLPTGTSYGKRCKNYRRALMLPAFTSIVGRCLMCSVEVVVHRMNSVEKRCGLGEKLKLRWDFEKTNISKRKRYGCTEKSPNVDIAKVSNVVASGKEQVHIAWSTAEQESRNISSWTKQEMCNDVYDRCVIYSERWGMIVKTFEMMFFC